MREILVGLSIVLGSGSAAVASISDSLQAHGLGPDSTAGFTNVVANQADVNHIVADVADFGVSGLAAHFTQNRGYIGHNGTEWRNSFRTDSTIILAPLRLRPDGVTPGGGLLDAVAVMADTVRASGAVETPDIRLHGPDTNGLAFEARMHYAKGLTFLDMDTAEYADERYHQSLLNSSSLLFLQEGTYYNQAETKVGFGEISIARYYDTLGGNPMFVTTLGQDLVLADGFVYAHGIHSGEINASTVSTGVVSADSVFASQVVTTPKWRVPDYVFEPDYKRKSLPEIESFVRANRHLPDVPSAKDIKERGMDLAEMNLRLLKTVEELTLHVIDLDKSLKSQQSENSKLAEKVEALQARKGKE